MPGDVRLCSACFQKAYRYAREKKIIPLPTYLPGFPLDALTANTTHHTDAGLRCREDLRIASALARDGIKLAITQDEYYSGRGCAILLALDDQLFDMPMGISNDETQPAPTTGTAIVALSDPVTLVDELDCRDQSRTTL